MPEPLLRVEKLSVSIGGVRVVDEVSFEIRRGEIYGLCGESGCGKTTAALAILRLLRPPSMIDQGHVIFDGRDVLRFSDHELREFRWREVSLVTQGAMNALNPVMRVGDQMADVLRARLRLSSSEARLRVAELLERVDLNAVQATSYPHQLSGGMRQRVVIAMALALDPKLVIMDEPTTALDVLVQREILDEIVRLRDALGLSILLVSHDLALLLEYASRLGVLYAGRLVETAPAPALLDDARHPYTQGLVRSAAHIDAIAGTPPDPRRPPPGCRFHPRCPRALDRCRCEAPLLTAISLDRATACHLGST
jgi:peptide/nickel transport system ATP-binding protein